MGCRRKFYLHGEEIDLKALVGYLTLLLDTDGDDSYWAGFGITFEDVDVEVK